MFFWIKSLTEIAIGLWFSPFDKGEHYASFYIWLKKQACKSDEQSMKFKGAPESWMKCQL